MIRGYAAVKGNLRRPRKGATIYKDQSSPSFLAPSKPSQGVLCSKALCPISPLQPSGREAC